MRVSGICTSCGATVNFESTTMTPGATFTILVLCGCKPATQIHVIGECAQVQWIEQRADHGS